MKQKQPEAYNSGYVHLYRRKEENLYANTNVSKKEDLNFICKLAYKEMSCRQQDFEFAEQNSFTLSLKVKTQRMLDRRKVDNHCFAIIGNILYAVGGIDSSQTELYFYLEEIKELKEENNESE